jgi:chitin synthase
VLLALILGLPAVLIVLTAHRWSYVVWMLIYLLSLPIWNFVLPVYAFWKFDDFSWGDTRKTAGEKTKKAGIEYEGEFDSSKITMKRWGEFEKERRMRSQAGWRKRPWRGRRVMRISILICDWVWTLEMAQHNTALGG